MILTRLPVRAALCSTFEVPDWVLLCWRQFVAKQKLQLSPAAGLALPNTNDFPSRRDQAFCLGAISLDCAVELGLPDDPSRLRGGGARAALVTMPVASVDEHNRPQTRQHDIRTARKIISMQPKAITHRVEGLSYQQLGQCVLALHPRHVGAAGGGGKVVHVGDASSRHSDQAVLAIGASISETKRPSAPANGGGTAFPI